MINEAGVHMLGRSMTHTARQRERGNTFKAMCQDSLDAFELLRDIVDKSDEQSLIIIGTQIEALTEVLTSDAKPA